MRVDYQLTDKEKGIMGEGLAYLDQSWGLIGADVNQLAQAKIVIRRVLGNGPLTDEQLETSKEFVSNDFGIMFVIPPNSGIVPLLKDETRKVTVNVFKSKVFPKYP